jgi:stage II sporulation protein D
MDQVYGGMNVESELPGMAVQETKGIIVTYDGEPAPVLYFSTCGGTTEFVDQAFTRLLPQPFLVMKSDKYITQQNDSTYESYYCKNSPVFEWEESWAADELLKILNEFLPSELNLDFFEELEKIYEIKILARSYSGRIKSLEIETDKGTFRIFGDRIRYVLRRKEPWGAILRSTMFEIDHMDGNGLQIWGRGYGHGVGLCQWGAMGMAAKGWNARQILSYYFPGIDLQKIY